MQLLAVFQEGSTLHRPAQNGGYGTSASSVGTASPELSPREDETTKFIEQPVKSFAPVSNTIENTNGEVKHFSRHMKSPPPPVAPKPVRPVRQVKHILSARSSFVESLPSEDSGISTLDDRDRYRNSSDSSKSEINDNVSVKPAIYKSRTGETTFVAIGRPIKSPVYNGNLNGERRRFSSTSSDHADNEHSEVEEETFSLGRNSTRKSMFVDSPMLDRWAELQEERMFGVSLKRIRFPSYNGGALYFSGSILLLVQRHFICLWSWVLQCMKINNLIDYD